MNVQIEVTTRCNFSCWYCVGRSMEQTDMDYSVFLRIINQLPEKSTVILQGEGEPLLWPFILRAAKDSKSLGHRVSLITNGSIMIDDLNHYLDDIKISLDSLDSSYCDSLGRHNVKKVTQNILEYRKQFGNKLILVSVDAGQDMTAVVEFAKANGIRHDSQKLQNKPDYVAVYPSGKVVYPSKTPTGKMNCGFGFTGKPLFYSVTGTALPCPLVKNLALFSSCESVIDDISKGVIPPSCSGCRNLRSSK